MQENEEVEYSFQQETSQKSVLNSLTATVECYRGRVKGPKWTDVETGSYFLPRQSFRLASQFIYFCIQIYFLPYVPFVPTHHE